MDCEEQEVRRLVPPKFYHPWARMAILFTGGAEIILAVGSILVEYSAVTVSTKFWLYNFHRIAIYTGTGSILTGCLAISAGLCVYRDVILAHAWCSLLTIGCPLFLFILSSLSARFDGKSNDNPLSSIYAIVIALMAGIQFCLHLFGGLFHSPVIKKTFNKPNRSGGINMVPVGGATLRTTSTCPASAPEGRTEPSAGNTGNYREPSAPSVAGEGTSDPPPSYESVTRRSPAERPPGYETSASLLVLDELIEDLANV